MDRIVPVSCLVAGFGISSVESSGSASTALRRERTNSLCALEV